MNAELAMQVKCDDPDLMVITGSRLYGTERRDVDGHIISDTDLRGVIVPPWEYLTVREFQQLSIPGEQDGQIYSIGFFIKQLIATNPQHLELLFVPDGQIVRMSRVGRELIELRPAFVTKRFYKRIFGFGNSEWRKARGVELEKTERTKDEAEVINDIRNVFGRYWGDRSAEIIEEILSLLFSEHPRTERPNRDKISGKRKVEFEKYGYGVSSACHAVRLARQCHELLSTGTMTFPRPDAKELADIKNGRLPIEKVELMYKDAIEKAEAAVKTTSLPERPDIKRIGEFYERTVATALLNDARMKNCAGIK